MRILMIVGVALMALAIGCDNLPIGGKCYDSNGDELTHVIDADGAEWDTKKVDFTRFGESLTGCGISRNAVLFKERRSPWDQVETPNGDRIDVVTREKDKWVLDTRITDWY